MQPLSSLACLTEALEGCFGRGPQQVLAAIGAPRPCPLPPALCQGLWVARVLCLVCHMSRSPSSAAQPREGRPKPPTFATVRGNRQFWGLGADSSPSLPYSGSQGPISLGPELALGQP